MCSRCLAASFRPKTDPTMSKKIEDRYVKAILPLFDAFEKKAVAAVESHARELAAPAVGLDLAWLATWLEKTIEETITAPARGTRDKVVTTAYKQGRVWADTNLTAIGIGGKVGAGPIERRALDVLKARNLSALKGITDELSKQIVASLSDGLMSGEGVPKLAARIRDRVDGIGRVRATVMARTETMYAVNTGTVQRYVQAGVTKVKFLAGLDERVCGECESHHGNEYAIADAPILPLHPNCRCTYVPVIEVPA